MPRAKIPEYWEAVAELEIENIAFTVPYDETGKGSRKIRTFRPDFLDKDGKVMFDVGRKLRGWMKQTVGTIKPSAGDVIRYGFKAYSFPDGGGVPIANKGELIGASDDDFPESFKKDYNSPSGLPFPCRETIVVKEAGKTRSTFSFHYVLPKKVRVKVKMFCFGRNITADGVRDLMTKLGEFTGLGDMSSQGYGHFKVLKFDEIAKGELNL